MCYLITLSREVVNQIALWKQHLPNVRPHYAVKCCPDKQALLKATLKVTLKSF